MLKKHSAFRQRHAFATLTQEFPRWTRIGVLLMSIVLLGCRTMPPLPKVSLTEPGWTVRQGQAIWHPKREGPEIAGELLVATRTNGTALVQFTKTPFPLVVAQQTRSSWEIEFPTEKKKYSAPGHPPGRLIWFWLVQALTGESLPKNIFCRHDQKSWHLENRVTGESLEGYFQESATLYPAPRSVRAAARLSEGDRVRFPNADTLEECARPGPSNVRQAGQCQNIPCRQPAEHCCARDRRTPVACPPA